MAASDEPAEDVIDNVCSLTGLTRAQAVSRLKANSNDPDRVVSEFFDDPNSTKYTWDESAFDSGRDGDQSNNAGIAFNIQGPDALPQLSHHNSAAPTRPPSRTNNRSPMGMLVDSTYREATGAPTTAADEAADLQRALAESAAESGLPPQEAGVVDNDTSVKHFGPANRSEYDQEQWALVPTKADEAAKPEPAPSARQRAPGTPAFLRSVKGRTNRHRTGGLVSIFHTIPATRNIMMLSGPLANNYGNHLDWWKGAPITKSVQYGTELSGDEDRPEFTEELQRLVAFLDGTERAYGTVDVLAETKAVDPSLGEWRPQHLEANFLSALLDAGISCAPEHINAMVSAAGLERALPEPDFEAGSAERFSFLDLKLEGESCSQVNTLYDALDRLFWNQAFSDSSQVMDEPVSAILETASDVFTIKFGGDGINKAIDIPAILYLDRYSSTRKDLAKLLQSRIRKTREMGLATIKKWEESALTCHGESGCRQMPDWLSNPHNSRNCWQKMIVTCEGLLERQRKNAQWRSMQSRMDEGAVPTLRDLYDLTTWSLPYELTDEERKKQQKWEQCIKTARERLEGINEQFTLIEARRRQCSEALEKYSKALTCREEEADAEFHAKYIHKDDPECYEPQLWSPSLRYELRGVATDPDITYLCVRREDDLIDLEGQASTPRDQWWKVGYSANDVNPITVEKTCLNDVLVAAGSESKYPILVYATEAAMQQEVVPLPSALRRFVQSDNRSFQQELAQEREQGEGAPAPEVPMYPGANSFASPAKRKHSRSSSLATLGSSCGGSDRNAEFSQGADPFGDSFGDDKADVLHREFARVNSPNSLGGLVENLEECKTTEPPPRRGEAPVAKVPEMQERSGRPISLMARPPGSAGATNTGIDLMDMELDDEMERHT